MQFIKAQTLFLIGIAGALLMVTTMEFQRKAERNGLTTVQDSIPKLDSTTGLKIAPGFDMVRAQCTACHSSRLILQYRATREGWKERIRWMQQKQNLWDLGENEPIILDYLAKNYGPEKKEVRREPLQPIEWYKLNSK
ncbi:hypothetical protein QNI19_21925 [Cytophagaceae bacterium DM2B3-1]|uniref:Monoheme cytochrome C n=1 Tax=Xanthocytophaga flava TaxID=3048013 RepID=A0ABT7CPF3_9BACT|nr:hypothetical protein [Xanthocytophaga flavus]MDJ1495613.1 hypothetical protein [Xanthocytophaga flavus]